MDGSAGPVWLVVVWPSWGHKGAPLSAFACVCLAQQWARVDTFWIINLAQLEAGKFGWPARNLLGFRSIAFQLAASSM